MEFGKPINRNESILNEQCLKFTPTTNKHCSTSSSTAVAVAIAFITTVHYQSIEQGSLLYVQGNQKHGKSGSGF